MSSLTRRSFSFGCVATILVIAVILTGCENKETGEAQPTLLPSPLLLPSEQATVQATPTIFVFQQLIESNLDLRDPPETVPLELEIPKLDVNAPVLAVGLTSSNAMDSPKGNIGDPIWNTAFWYRGGGVPGDIGTATIAGHVNDPLGESAIFAHLEDLKPGDLIVIRLKYTTLEIDFTVDQVVVYSVKESSDPAVLTQIYGAGPVAGSDPLPSPDGLSHLSLVTCAGDIIDGQFDHHTVVYATRSK